MDNKTHMMFHDEDVRAEGQNMAIKKTVTILKQMDIPEAEIAHKVQQAFDLSEQEISTLLSTK